MKEIRITMGMPASVEVIGDDAAQGIDSVFACFAEVDARFSPYRADSEVSLLNRDRQHTPSADLAEILAIAERTRVESGGFFNATRPDGCIDPTGIVKGWAIHRAALKLRAAGYENFCVDIGGDIACSGVNADGNPWQIGIRNPFAHGEVIKTLAASTAGVATSGTAARGDHIYNPYAPTAPIRDVVSITVVGPDVLTADRLATAAFAMGADGVRFVEALPGCEAYQVGADGIATMTSGFRALCV
ncbi:MAG TPA: FAD:protein FMN transferase [Candidatus Paceibacterota bacterium]|nr:FAD:protein FMN transferase [Candidatus Paceibacterota bacterium]